jgi:cation diffusion facilitator family transporter
VKIGERFEFPPEQEAARAKARRLSWATIVLLAVASFGLAVTLGGSQAMKTAWISDLLSMVPPAAILWAMRKEEKPPNARFPFGYFRAVSVAFLATAAVLMIIGLWLFFDSVMKLVGAHRPPIGAAALFGHTFHFWAGWMMIGALAFSMSVAIVVGQLKRPVAETLHDKTLLADAEMNRAEWMSEGAAIAGILLIGLGFWWGDAATAAFISLNIIWDGWHNLRQVLGDLMDESPTELGGKELEKLPEQLREAAERMEWVEKAAVRVREHGHVLVADVFVVPRGDGALVERIDRASDELRRLDWRIYSVAVVPTADLDDAGHPRD